MYNPERVDGCIRCRSGELAASDRGGLRALMWVLVLCGGLVGWTTHGPQLMASLRRGVDDLPPRVGTTAAATAQDAHAAATEVSGVLRTRNSAGRSGALFVPGRPPGHRFALLVVLHGTGGSGRGAVEIFQPLARKLGFAILAPDSRRSPSGQWTWQVGDQPGDVTPDLRHVLACLQEVSGTWLRERLDRDRVLIAGFSGGASSAPYIATNREPFASYAVLHGGVFAEGLGRRQVRGWFSTGAADGLRPPAGVRSAAIAARAHGQRDVVYREFPGGHRVSAQEAEALVAWWLGLAPEAVRQ